MISPFSPSGRLGVYTPVTVDNKTAAVAFTHALSSYVNDAYATWATGVIPRCNPGYVDYPVWSYDSISFEGVIAPDSNSDLDFAVIQNGVLFAYCRGAADGVYRRFNVFGLTPGAHIQIWEPSANEAFGVANDWYNTNADSPKATGYISALYLPVGVAAPVPATTTHMIVQLGMSITNSDTDTSPNNVYGNVGQQRLLAHAKGWEMLDFAYGAGTFWGDGFTAAQRAADVYRGYVKCGSPAAVTIYVDHARNDYSYYGAHGFGCSPTTWATNAAAFRTAVLALIPQATFVACTTISQTTESANTGGFTLPDYRTAISGLSGWTIVDGVALNITKPTYRDDVHMTAAGVQRYGHGPTDTEGVWYATGVLP